MSDTIKAPDLLIFKQIKARYPPPEYLVLWALKAYLYAFEAYVPVVRAYLDLPVGATRTFGVPYTGFRIDRSEGYLEVLAAMGCRVVIFDREGLPREPVRIDGGISNVDHLAGWRHPG